MINIVDCDLDRLRMALEGKGVICFGAGEELAQLQQRLPEISKHIECVVDNLKAGEHIEIGKKTVQLISFEESKRYTNNYIFIITTIKYAEIFLDQLDNCEAFNGKDVIVSYFLYKDVILEDGYLEIQERPAVIPKKIHYCWFGGKEIPKQFADNIDTWRRYCPDYEIIEWNESNYNIEKNKYMKQAYESNKWGFVPDYARLDIINQQGGIYLDVDVQLLKPIDILRGFNMFCGFEDCKYVNFGLGFGAVPGHKVIQKMLSMYDDLSFITDDGELNLVASPYYQTKVLNELNYKLDGHTIMTDEIVIFSSEFFSPVNCYGYGVETENSFSIHQYAGTWLSGQPKKHLEIMKYNIGKLLGRMNK